MGYICVSTSGISVEQRPENQYKIFPRLRVAKCTLYISNTYMGNASRLSSKKNRGLRCAEKKFSLNCNGEDRLRRGIAGSRIRCELEFFAIFFMRLIERYLAHSLNIINISEARYALRGIVIFQMQVEEK